MSMAEVTPVDAQTPWPWLDPFTESSSQFFHGRGADIDALERCVTAAPVCVLFGRSGLGKTSLIQAGVFPRLRRRQLLPVRLRRLEHGAQASSVSEQLLKALDGAVQAADLHWGGASRERPSDTDAALWELLHERDRPLLDAPGRRWTPVFVVDQFEEIFTLEPDPQRRLRTFQRLGDVVENRVPPAVAARLDCDDDLVDRFEFDLQSYRVVLVLREDFLPELESWTQSIPRLAHNRYRLQPMTQAQAMDSVQLTGGTLVDHTGATKIVDFLARQGAQRAVASGAATARNIEPALLCLICASLNADRLARQPPGATLDVSDLDERGAEILDSFYDRAFAALPGTQRDAASRWVESNLITEGGTRRPYPLRAIDVDLEPALRTLVDQRLLRIQNTEGGDQIELVHDRLAAIASRRAQTSQERALHEQRLRQERDEAERRLLKETAAAADLARDREALERRVADERAALERSRADAAHASSRRARKTNVALAAALLFAIAGGGWAVLERDRAEAAALDLKEAIAQTQRQYEERLALASTVKQAARVLDSRQPDAGAKASELLLQATRAPQGNARPAQGPSGAPSCPDGRRLYPQIGDKGDLALIDKISPSLRRANFIVLNTEVLEARKMPRATEVRYFRTADEDGAIAATVALARSGIQGVPARYVKGYEDSKSIRACHYELWLVTGGEVVIQLPEKR